MNKPKPETADTVTLWAADFDYNGSVRVASGKFIERAKTYRLVECSDQSVFGYHAVIYKADNQVFGTEAEAVEALIKSTNSEIEYQESVLAKLTQRRQNAANMLATLSKVPEESNDDN